MVDRYQLLLNGAEDKTIYICPYGHDSSFVPHGMLLIENKSQDLSSLKEVVETDPVCNESFVSADSNIENRDIEDDPSKILFCRYCGFKLLDDSDYCSRCGKKVN